MDDEIDAGKPSHEKIELEKLLADLPPTDDNSVNIYRVLPNRQQSWIFSFTPGEINYSQLLVRLRDEFEGGTFRIVGRNMGDYVFNRGIMIERPKARPVQDVGEIVRQQLAAASPQGHSSDNTVLLEVLRVMQAGFSELGRAIVAGGQNPGDSEDRFMQRMVQMRALFAPEKVPESSGIDTFLKGLEFGKSVMDNAGNANELDVMRDAVKSFGPVLVQAMSKSAPIQATASR